MLTAAALLPALATLAAGASFLLPRRARSASVGRAARTAARLWRSLVLRSPLPPAAPVPDAFARALEAAATPPSETPDDAGPAPRGVLDEPRFDFEAESAPSSEREREPAPERTGELEPARSAAPAERAATHVPRARGERSVPLTRLPLRRRHGSVDWPLLLESGGAAAGPEARRRLLADLAQAEGIPREAVLIAAYREEDAAGRVLALRGLKRCRSDDARAIFVEALRDGSDDERALAVDALAACGPPETLTPALTDRVDAIAARAALGFVASREPLAYRVALAPYVDAARIDVLLALLAGYLA